MAADTESAKFTQDDVQAIRALYKRLFDITCESFFDPSVKESLASYRRGVVNEHAKSACDALHALLLDFDGAKGQGFIESEDPA